MTPVREPDSPPQPCLRPDDAGAAATVRRMADCARALATGGGPAEAVTALFTGALRFDADDPHWPDRDRIVVAAPLGEALVRAVLELTGHAGSVEDHPAFETVSGPPGQALGVAVGMALAERMLAARFGRSLVDHRTWVLLAPADLAGGPGHEAADLAGHLQLDRLAAIWEDDGTAGLFCATDPLKRFAAAGWATRRVDGHDPAEVLAALVLAARSRKPTLIACGTNGMDGQEAASASDDLLPAWRAAGTRGAAARRGWKKRLSRHAMRADFERVTAGRLPDGWTTALAALRPALDPGSTGDAGRQVAGTLAQAVPELVGATPAGLAGLAAVTPGQFQGQAVPHGARPHGLSACTAGLALHGGVVPFAVADLQHGDALRPALRLLAASRQRAVHLLDDDGTEPEQLAALRTVPGLHLHHPADPAEVGECWELAMRRTDGPSVLVLSACPGPVLRADTAENRCARGGYVLAEANGPRQATLIASGPAVHVAMAARAELAASGVAVAVVSLPCWELFAGQPPGETALVLGDAPRAALASGDGFGWDRWLGRDGLLISLPPDALTAGAVAWVLRKRLPLEEEKVP